MLDPSDETPLFERFSFGNLNDEARDRHLAFVDQYYEDFKSAARSVDGLEAHVQLQLQAQAQAQAQVHAPALPRQHRGNGHPGTPLYLSIFMLSRESADSEFPSRVAQLLYQLSLLEESSGQQSLPDPEIQIFLLTRSIKMSFKILNKYLFDRSGSLVGSWSSMTKPDSLKIINKIEQLI